MNRYSAQLGSGSSGLKGHPFSQPGLKALDIGVLSDGRAEGPAIREHGVVRTASEWPARWALGLIGGGQGLQPWL